ncbi:MAG: type 3 dihydrofolate reductase [Kangiellaceae bacterium]|nr:type 3 dihydrofolate reductase [Kangiellaceae bacterium]
MSKPKISLIAAMAKNRIIGKGNKMPWHLPADLKHFKTVTMSKPIVMGRKTYQSIGRSLPGRKNVVISRNPNFQAEGCELVDSIEGAFELLKDDEEIMIIGGGFLYSQCIDKADKLFLTFIDLEIDGDTQFPEYHHLKLNEVSLEKHLSDDKNLYNYEFVEYHISPE